MTDLIQVKSNPLVALSPWSLVTWEISWIQSTYVSVLVKGYFKASRRIIHPAAALARCGVVFHSDTFEEADLIGLWSLAGKTDKIKAYVQCLDPVSYTTGGTAILKISKIDDS